MSKINIIKKEQINKEINVPFFFTYGDDDTLFLAVYIPESSLYRTINMETGQSTYYEYDTVKELLDDCEGTKVLDVDIVIK